MATPYITAEHIDWDDDFQPIFDKGNSTFAKGESSIKWLCEMRRQGKFLTGVRSYQREKVAPIEWKQQVMVTILEGGYKSIPEIHVRVKNPECYELTDGQQRTSAPLDFMENEFPLPKKLVVDGVDLGGLYWKDLKGDLEWVMKRIDNYAISTKWYVNLTDRETSELFIEVLNNTNTMNAQEIRNAVLGVYSNFVRDTARKDPFSPESFHGLFERTTKNNKEVLVNFSPKFSLNGRMEVDEWLQNLCFLFHEKHDWTKGCSSQVQQTAWVKKTQGEGGIFVEGYYESKLITEILNLAKSILEVYPNKQRLAPMVSLMVVCYAVHLIGIKGKGKSRKLNKTVNHLNPVIFAKKFEEVFVAWSTHGTKKKKALYDGHTMYGSDNPMEPFNQLFGGKNSVAIGTIKKVLDQYTPEEWGVSVRDAKTSFPKDMIMERLAEQGGKCFWTGMPINEDQEAGDHYLPRSKGGATVKENLVVTSRKLNNIRLNTSAKDFSEILVNQYNVTIDHEKYLQELNNG